MFSKSLNKHEYSSSQGIEENIITDQTPSEEIFNNYGDFCHQQVNKQYDFSLDDEGEKKEGNNKGENDAYGYYPSEMQVENLGIVYKGTIILNSQKDHDINNLDFRYSENIQDENNFIYSESIKSSENLNSTNENSLTEESKGIEEKKILEAESDPLPKVNFCVNKKGSTHQEIIKNEEEENDKKIIMEEEHNSVFTEENEDKTLLRTKRKKSSTEKKSIKKKKRNVVYNDLYDNDNSYSLISKLCEERSLSDIEEEIKSKKSPYPENDTFNSENKFPHCNIERYNEQIMINEEEDGISEEVFYFSVEENPTNFETNQ